MTTASKSRSNINLQNQSQNFLNAFQVHLRKLIGSDHPVLRTAKRLIYHGKNKMQAGLHHVDHDHEDKSWISSPPVPGARVGCSPPIKSHRCRQQHWGTYDTIQYGTVHIYQKEQCSRWLILVLGAFKIELLSQISLKTNCCLVSKGDRPWDRSAWDPEETCRDCGNDSHGAGSQFRCLEMMISRRFRTYLDNPYFQEKKPRNGNKYILIILIVLVSKTILRNDIKMSIHVLQSIHQSVVNLPVNIAEEEVSLYKW